LFVAYVWLNLGQMLPLRNEQISKGYEAEAAIVVDLSISQYVEEEYNECAARDHADSLPPL
jgi:hypothetical protein